MKGRATISCFDATVSVGHKGDLGYAHRPLGSQPLPGVGETSQLEAWGMIRRRLLSIFLPITLLGLVFLGWVFYTRIEAHQAYLEQARLAAEDAALIRAQTVRFSERRVLAGATFAQALGRLEVEPAVAAAVAEAAQSVYNLRGFRTGNRLAVGRSVDGELRMVRYQIDQDRMLWVRAEGHRFRAEIQRIPSDTVVVPVAGEVRDSLYNAVIEAGESAELAVRLAEIFAWDLDFYTDPRRGDRFRLLVEKKRYANGETVAYGKIYAAEYNNDGRAYQAVLFRDPSGRPAYYGADGKSLEKAFLRSPLKFAAPITSRFSRSRFHPVLKTRRPHLGIDYGAPTGTPVQAIGSGSVVFAGRKGGAGNMVHVRHSNGYETMYMHLSRILVHPGQKVEQGQRIGLVGATGLATGPHLDFRVLQHGSYRNFEALNLPPAVPVAKKDWAEFASLRDSWLGKLSEAGSMRAQVTPLERSPASSQ